jgi:deoxyribose-phosphate aldolase
MDDRHLLSIVDHTLLKPEATHAQVITLCEEAASLHTASVCVNSYWVTTVEQALSGTGVLTCSVVGFPLGAMSTASVADETSRAVDHGAQEVDMVIPVGLVKSGDWAAAGAYVAAVRAAARTSLLKVILETALLSDDEIVAACKLSVDAGAEFVKTSTGFTPAGGATEHAVALMRETVGSEIGVKASGGVRTLADARRMVSAGASRLGMSSTVSLAEEISHTSS